MKNFLKPTKDKIIFTFVIPSYLIFSFDYLFGNTHFFWLPVPIVLFFGLVIFIAYKGTYDSRINFILQKLQQEQLLKQENISPFLIVIEFLTPFIFNYLLACLFFHWYYRSRKQENKKA